MKIKYEDWKPRKATHATIENANRIIDEYQSQGFNLTLRQLYYAFVSRGMTPNNDREYDRLGEVMDRARLAGMVDWDAIEDRTRVVRENYHWDDPGEIIQAAADSYRMDLWRGQPTRVEVFIEKDALVGLIEGPCRKLDVPCFSCRGYPSQSAIWRAARKYKGYHEAGQGTIILHLGDHDPSGIDMTRDLQERLLKLSDHAPIEVRRIALTMEQVDKYRPPENPAKIEDSRAKDYVARFGDKSWELDALEPRLLISLVEDHVRDLMDVSAYEKSVSEQEEGRSMLKDVAQKF